MSISRPLLPPKAGYVEVVDEYGNHMYKPTPETEQRLKQTQTTEELSQSVNTLLGKSDDVQDPTAAEFHRAVQLFAATLTDETTMMEIPSIYPEYRVGVAYKTKDIFRYGTNSVGDPQLYQVLQDHTSAAEHTPDTATALYKKVGVTEDGTPQWVQPLGATDAYNAGDIVMHKDKKWESEIDANVWEPGVYGWKEVTAQESDPEEPADDTPEFVQPSGAHDAYKKGAQVMYNGRKYESLIDGNTYSPDAYPNGWKLVET